MSYPGTRSSPICHNRDPSGLYAPRSCTPRRPHAILPRYTFAVSRGYQEYTMVCMLCGRGAGESAIHVSDPRKERGIF